MKAKMAGGLEIFIESVNYIIISYALSNMALLFWRNSIDAFDSALSATETRRFTVGKKVPITWGKQHSSEFKISLVDIPHTTLMGRILSDGMENRK